MKVLTLSCVLLSLLYYFTQESPQDLAQDDAIELKVSAPERVKKIAPRRQIVAIPIPEVEESAPREELIESAFQSNEEDESQIQHFAEPSYEKGQVDWRLELAEHLQRVDPIAGEEIYAQVIAEKEGHKLELVAFEKEMKEHAYQGDEEEYFEILDHLKSRHEEKLKEIMGHYYEEAKGLIKDDESSHANNTPPTETSDAIFEEDSSQV